MNRKIGMTASLINVTAVFLFAVSMLLGFDFGSYFSSMFIAFSFVPVICAYACFSNENAKLAGFTAVSFAAVYAAVILLVYFAQLTTVRAGSLTGQAAQILDFKQFGLFFNYDLLGYGCMALATFFAGLTVEIYTKADKWLKALLLIHGVFFLSCLTLPLLGVFTSDGEAWVGVAVLEFWCVYFIPVGILSFLHFTKCKTPQ
ncbi:MAG: hypothetical protein Q4G07_00455 [Oscillospiraceae bacterium]|nr:hypothetical protein [Oscillospiraceae bacterium]